MKTTDRANRATEESVSLEFELPHPPSRVWRALTDPALLGEWLLPVADFQLTPGAEFTFRAPAYPGWDGVVQCRLLEIDEPRKLSYTWVSGGVDSVVTFTLDTIASGTRLSLVQDGFRQDQKKNLAGARHGWTMMGGKLGELLARNA